MELAPGTILGGRYRVVGLLGSGGMGSVYEAVQEGLDRRVALKVLHPHLVKERELLERFKQEAHTIASLGHPNVVQVSDFQTNAGEPPFFVMELLQGESLSELLKREPQLPPSRVAYIAVQVLSALGAAHKAEIVHRDIKPDNIFLCRTSVQSDLVKVLDFGVAKVTRAPQDQKLTRTGFVVGTLAYMSPEQARGDKLDGRADLYSLGACLYRALAGRKPFDAATTPALVAQILKEKPVPLAALRTDCDAAFLALVERALEKARDARFDSAEDMANALAPFARPTTSLDDARAAPKAAHPQSSAPTVRHPGDHAPPPSVAIETQRLGTRAPDAPSLSVPPVSEEAPVGQRSPQPQMPSQSPPAQAAPDLERTLRSDPPPAPAKTLESGLRPEVVRAALARGRSASASVSPEIGAAPRRSSGRSPFVWLALVMVPVSLLAIAGLLAVASYVMGAQAADPSASASPPDAPQTPLTAVDPSAAAPASAAPEAIDATPHTVPHPRPIRHDAAATPSDAGAAAAAKAPTATAPPSTAPASGLGADPFGGR